LVAKRSIDNATQDTADIAANTDGHSTADTARYAVTNTDRHTTASVVGVIVVVGIIRVVVVWRGHPFIATYVLG